MNGRRLLIPMIAAVFVALLATPGAAQADAKLTEHTFRDNFTTDLDPAYWTTSKQGDTYIGTSLGQLQMFIPAEVTGNPFWAAAGPIPGFSTKADSVFDISVSFNCLQWPAKNGIRLALNAYVYDKHGKVILTFQAGRLSDTDGSERYMVIVPGKTRYAKAKSTTGKLRIRWVDTAPSYFLVTVGPSDKPEYLSKFYRAKVPQVGVVVWGLSVWGHDYAHAKEPVRVDFGDFRVYSKKGFIYPKSSGAKGFEPH
jgi:hypothetical protein